MKAIRMTEKPANGRTHRWMSSMLITSAGMRPKMPFTRGARPVIATEAITPRMMPDLPKAAANGPN